jgi:hypothetical protein
MVALREYLETHPDHENLLYLTDSEVTLSATLLIKVKAHRGYPLNEEADMRAEMGRRMA